MPQIFFRCGAKNDIQSYIGTIDPSSFDSSWDYSQQNHSQLVLLHALKLLTSADTVVWITQSTCQEHTLFSTTRKTCLCVVQSLLAKEGSVSCCFGFGLSNCWHTGKPTSRQGDVCWSSGGNWWLWLPFHTSFIDKEVYLSWQCFAIHSKH